MVRIAPQRNKFVMERPSQKQTHASHLISWPAPWDQKHHPGIRPRVLKQHQVGWDRHCGCVGSPRRRASGRQPRSGRTGRGQRRRCQLPPTWRWRRRQRQSRRPCRSGASWVTVWGLWMVVGWSACREGPGFGGMSDGSSWRPCRTLWACRRSRQWRSRRRLMRSGRC